MKKRLFWANLYVGGKQLVQAGSEVTSVKSSVRIVSTSDQQNIDDIITYPSSPRASRVVNVPIQPPPPPAVYTASRRDVDESRTTSDDRDSSCWRQQDVERTSTKHHICTLPHGRRAPVAQPLRHYPLWN